MKKHTPLFIGGLILAAVLLFFSQKNKVNMQKVTKIDSQEFDELARDLDTFVLDVHIPEQSHIPGTDAFIAYNEIEKNLDQLPEDKNTPILVYCRSGSMSDDASKELAGLGYTNVHDLVGGVNAYREQHVSVDIAPDTHDFGEVVYGDIPQSVFTLTNFTPVPLTITRISTSCSCTRAEIEKMSLKPYESTNVTVYFDPAVHKDDSDLGDVVRTIYIETDNVNFPKVESVITAKVVKK